MKINSLDQHNIHDTFNNNNNKDESNQRTATGLQLGFLKRIFTTNINTGSAGSGSGTDGLNSFFGQPFPSSYNLFDDNTNLKASKCPLCDSSVYSYCSDKLLHDACCCLNPYEDQLPYQCRFADCSFLHANSCREHRLITRCCCNNLYLENIS
ncbi:uncharacterized protein LOC123294120 [Chrysoperla carnea]|uniref:uncharacterized protein LOC123294120 n=1 Tax=Chrysoperla carnea TaxID=189513 RepID=UPI001D084887|nr:uncharacterized protein LOC123294120 [Chrysoperla carnea]